MTREPPPLHTRPLATRTGATITRPGAPRRGIRTRKTIKESNTVSAAGYDRRTFSSAEYRSRSRSPQNCELLPAARLVPQHRRPPQPSQALSQPPTLLPLPPPRSPFRLASHKQDPSLHPSSPPPRSTTNPDTVTSSRPLCIGALPPPPPLPPFILVTVYPPCPSLPPTRRSLRLSALASDAYGGRTSGRRPTLLSLCFFSDYTLG
ncbi:hypothetical protein R3P38DRAFT_491572 [Favolaschia claudopus]|uniref:Uncharacterized protein n=1 Tax=Favolaschia claudopus TaxID=2862362 RepID=A0AAW0CJJ2_9AGAR